MRGTRAPERRHTSTLCSRDLEIEKVGKGGGGDRSRSRSCYLGLMHGRGARFAQIYQTWMVKIAQMGGEKWGNEFPSVWGRAAITSE